MPTINIHYDGADGKSRPVGANLQYWVPAGLLPPSLRALTDAELDEDLVPICVVSLGECVGVGLTVSPSQVQVGDMLLGPVGFGWEVMKTDRFNDADDGGPGEIVVLYIGGPTGNPERKPQGSLHVLDRDYIQIWVYRFPPEEEQAELSTWAWEVLIQWIDKTFQPKPGTPVCDGFRYTPGALPEWAEHALATGDLTGLTPGQQDFLENSPEVKLIREMRRRSWGNDDPGA